MHRISSAMLVWALVLPAAAADKFDAEARARAIARFVDGQTICVAHVDLTRIDADALLGWAVEVGRMDAKEIEGPRRAVTDWLTSLTKAGGKELYVVVSLPDLLIETPLVIVPLAEGSDAQAVRNVLGQVKAFEQLRFETFEQNLIGGGEGARKRLKGAKPSERPEVAKAFAAAGDTSAQVILLPTSDTRRVISELLPTLPPQIGGGSTRPLSHGLLWATLGVDLPPKLSVRLVIQSPDADSARALNDCLGRLLKSLAGLADGGDFMPVLGRLAEVFKPKVQGDQLTFSGLDKELMAFAQGMVRSILQQARRRNVENRLHQLAIAIQNYADTNKGRLPAVANFDKQGKPLLSWRVHLLPYLGANDLYKQFHLDEPWDSPHNRKLLDRIPAVYQGPNRKLNAEGKTIFLLPVGKQAAFRDGPERLRFPQDLADGTSNTIIIVEADDAHAVFWTKPEDLTYDRERPERGLGGHFQEVLCLAAMADGSVRMIAKGITKKTLQLAFDPADGMPMPSDW